MTASATGTTPTMATVQQQDASLVLVRHGRTTWVEEGRFQGATDVPLSALGRAQAAAVGARLADPSASPPLPVPRGVPAAIRHSPLSRAADTANAIARARGTLDALVADADLREIAQGEWEGLRHEEVMAGWGRDLAMWRQDPVHHHAPGGESLLLASERAARAVERVLADVGIGLRAATEPGARPALADQGGRPEPGDPRGGGTSVDDAEAPGPGAAPTVAEDDPWSITVAHDGILRLMLLRLLGLPVESYWSLPFALCAVTVVEIRAGRARLRAHNLEDHLARVDAAGALEPAAH